MSNLNELKNISILYADDDDILRQSTTNTLKTLFKNVYSAKDGKEALEIYNSHINDIQIIMLDIKMGSISGIEVAQNIRLTNEKIPMFLVSSYTEIDDLLDSIKLNLVDYLQKPVTFKKLTEVFTDCLKMLEKNNFLVQNLEENINYNPFSKEVISHGNRILLSKNEIQAIELLILKRGQIIKYEYFAEIMGDEVSEIAIKNTISRLRKKINCSSIKNVAKIGYILSIE